MKLRFHIAVLLFAGLAVVAQAREASPLLLYGELFERVQAEELFPDSKTFADARPRSAPADILRHYQQERFRPGFIREERIRCV